MIELLAALSVSAAVGIRIALPLLVIGFFYGDSFWSQVPVFSHIPPAIVAGVLVSWSLVELFASKSLLGQRILQIVQLFFGPFVGALVGVAVARMAEVDAWLVGVFGAIAGLLALVVQLVQVGWFYRLRGLPLWAIFVQDGLCVLLVMLAFDAPEQGGIIALLLLWLAIRSSREWRHWYWEQAKLKNSRNPRQDKREPD